MNVHNIMEDLVTQRVNALYEHLESEGTPWLSCSCENCRLDAISYVLNRIPPRYVVSGRGVTHNANKFSQDIQIRADIDALGIEGIRLINQTKRPFHTLSRAECEVEDVAANPVFNFPTFIGSVLDGATFEPITGATVSLFLNGELVSMVDKTWANPAQTFKTTHGTYSFWVRPIPTQQAQESMRFDFTIEVNAPGYLPCVSSVSVPVESELTPRRELNSTYSLKLKDIVLFRQDNDNDDE